MMLCSCSSMREKAALSRYDKNSERETLMLENTGSLYEDLSFHQSERNVSRHIFEIKPKGVFSFTADGGFKGEASYIKIMEHSTSTKNLDSRNKATQSAGRKLQTKVLAKQEQGFKATEIKTRKPLFNGFNLSFFLLCSCC